MKLFEVVEPIKAEIFGVQQWLIERGWDDVKVGKGDEPGSFHLELLGPKDWKVSWVVHSIAPDLKGSLRWMTPHSSAEVNLTTEEFKKNTSYVLAWFKVRSMVNFSEKPESFAYVKSRGKFEVPLSKIRPLIDEGLISTYSWPQVFSSSSRAPQAGFRSTPMFDQSPKAPERMIVVALGENNFWLADVMSANTYVREWAYIDHAA